MDKIMSASTALENIALIDLKIAENKRLRFIAVDDYKSSINKENVGKKKSEQKIVDLRQCKEYNKYNLLINSLIDQKREIILNTPVSL